MKNSILIKSGIHIDKTFVGIGLLCLIVFCKVQVTSYLNSVLKEPSTQTDWLLIDKDPAGQQPKVISGLEGTRTASL